MEQPRVRLANLMRWVEGSLSLERKSIPDGNYSIDELLAQLVNGWLPYWECHKCGRFETCPHVVRKPTNPRLAREIQCGVAKLALRNFLRVSWQKFGLFDTLQKQHFIDGLYHWTQYVLNTEIDIGSYTDERLVVARGNALTRRIMSYVSLNRRHLEKFAYYFRGLPGFAEAALWVLVEGEAEKEFLERLLELRAIDFRVLGVETYGGKGNAKPKKLHLDHLEARGLKAVLQSDSDGKARLERRGLVKVMETKGGIFFTFTPDFESVFPPQILHAALEIKGLWVDQGWLAAVMGRGGGKIVQAIEQKIGTSISKRDLARTLADVVDENWHIMENDWPDNPITGWITYLKFGEGYDVLEED